jgi:hypothetical protein
MGPSPPEDPTGSAENHQCAHDDRGQCWPREPGGRGGGRPARARARNGFGSRRRDGRSRGRCGGGEGDHLIRRRCQQDAATHAGGGEVIGRHSNRRLLSHRTGGRVEPVQRARLRDAPHQAGRGDRGPAARARAPRQPQRGGRRSRRDGHDAAEAREVDRGAERRAPSVDIVRADRTQQGLLATDPPEVGAVEQIGDLALAGDHHLPVGQQDRLHREVEVVAVVRCPRGRSEELFELQCRRELEDRVAVVIGEVGRSHRAVAGADPDVAAGIDGGCSPAHPDGSLLLVGTGVDGEIQRCATGLPHRHHPSPVRTTIPVVAPEPEHHLARVERQTGALQQRRRICARWVDVAGHLYLAGRGVETDEHVGRRPVDQFVSHREDLCPCRVDDRCAGDPHRGLDVSTRKRIGGYRPGHVGRPHDGPGGRGQGVHGVVLGGHVDPACRHQGLPVKLPVEGGRGPGRGRGVHRRDRRGDTVSRRVLVIHRPGARPIRCCRGHGGPHGSDGWTDGHRQGQGRGGEANRGEDCHPSPRHTTRVLITRPAGG